jgi:hypothetical protein
MDFSYSGFIRIGRCIKGEQLDRTPLPRNKQGTIFLEPSVARIWPEPQQEGEETDDENRLARDIPGIEYAL